MQPIVDLFARRPTPRFKRLGATVRGRPAPEADYCTKEGAELLKQKIDAYWAERGQSVSCFLKEATFTTAMRSGRFDVRSDMRNGLPTVTVALPSQKDAA